MENFATGHVLLRLCLGAQRAAQEDSRTVIATDWSLRGLSYHAISLIAPALAGLMSTPVRASSAQHQRWLASAD